MLDYSKEGSCHRGRNIGLTPIWCAWSRVGWIRPLLRPRRGLPL